MTEEALPLSAHRRATFLQGDRVVLREWCDTDLAPFAEMNSDSRVRRYFPSTLTRAESDAAASGIRAHFARHGFGFWAVEIPGLTPFIGFVGLLIPSFEADFTPCVEIGWQIASAHWNQR